MHTHSKRRGMTQTLTTGQLRDWFDDTEKIVTDVTVSINNLKQFTGALDRKRNAPQEDTFGTFFSEKVQFTLVVQLCKLYINKDTERRNFIKLFNRLKYDKYNNRLKQRLGENRGKAGRVSSKAELISLVNGLVPELEVRSDLINRMQTLRDRLYAHSDPGHFLPEVTMEELDDLVQLAVKIFKTTSGSIFGDNFVDGEGMD